MSQIRCFYRKTAKLKIMATYKCSIFLSQTTNEKAVSFTHDYSEIKLNGCRTKPLVPVDENLNLILSFTKEPLHVGDNFPGFCVKYLISL